MQALSDADLLDVWERGLGQGAVQRALSLLVAASPGRPIDELARLSVGQRDAALLQFRTRVFGPRVVSVTKCQACGQETELNFEIAQIMNAPAIDAPTELELTLQLEMDVYRVRFRLPNSHDLRVAEQAASDEDARHELLNRCLLAADCGGVPCSARELPPEIVRAISERMSETDPLADVRLSGTCPRCGAEWIAPFDIVSYFWTELSAWARRQLREVHLLASAYGWSEAEILALGPARRGMYLELLE